MPSWEEVERTAPGLATAVRERFDAHRHKLAWVRVGDPADHLVIEPWSDGGLVRRVERR